MQIDKDTYLARAESSVGLALGEGLLTDVEAKFEMEQVRAFSIMDLFAPDLDYEKGAPVAMLDGHITAALTRQFFEWLASVPRNETPHLVLNSTGGSAVTGIALQNIMKRDRRVVVEVTGVAASAGSLIVQGAKERVMRTGSTMLIHNTMLSINGNAKTHKRAVAFLQEMDSSVLRIYESRVGKATSVDDLIDLMDKDMPISAEDAVKRGLADRVADESPSAGLRAPGTPKEEAETRAAVVPANAPVPQNQSEEAPQMESALKYVL